MHAKENGIELFLLEQPAHVKAGMFRQSMVDIRNGKDILFLAVARASVQLQLNHHLKVLLLFHLEFDILQIARAFDCGTSSAPTHVIDDEFLGVLVEHFGVFRPRARTLRRANDRGCFFEELIDVLIDEQFKHRIDLCELRA